MRKQNYSPELREKVVREYLDTQELSTVCRANNVPITTARTWVLKAQGKPTKSNVKRETYQNDVDDAVVDLKTRLEQFKSRLAQSQRHGP